MGELMLGFLAGCLYTYLVLYLPSIRATTKYQEHLERRLRERSW